MKKVLAIGLVLLSGVSYGAEATYLRPRQSVVHATVTGGTEKSLSITAGVSAEHSRKYTCDVFVQNVSGDTTEGYWNFASSADGATVDGRGATLVASTGKILIKDVPLDFVFEWVGSASAIIEIWFGGDR